MSAEEVRRRSFATAFRGFDQSEVRAFLDRMADEMAAAEKIEREMREELRIARDRLLHPRLDEDTLTSALGEEAARILRSAHEAAADLRAKAEENAARMLAEAHADAERIRAAADSVLSERTSEAERAAEALRRSAESSAAEMVNRARGQAETALAEVRSASEAMAEEADQLKVRVLGELAQRRRVMNAQVEQLAAGRDSILRAVQTVRNFLDEVISGLDSAEGDAKRAAAEALQRALARNESDMEELENEIGPSLTVPMALLSEVSSDLARSLDALEQKAPPQISDAPAASDLPPPPDRSESAEPVTEVVVTGEILAAEPAASEPSVVETGVMAAVAPESAPEPAGAEVASASSPTEPEETAAEEPPATPSFPSPNAPRKRLSLLRRVPTIDPDDDALESVRIIRPEPAPEAPQPPPPPVAEEPPTVVTPAAAEEPVVEEPRVDEPTVEVSVISELVVAEPAVEEVAAAPAVAPEPEDASGDATAKVDELFARLRAEREAARAKAEEVLASAEEAEPEDVPGPTAETPGAEVEAAADVAAAVDATATSAEDEYEVEVSDDDDAAGQLLEARNQALAPVHERLARRLKRTLQDDQNALLDRVRGEGRGGRHPSLPDQSEHETLYVSAVSALVDEAHRAGTAFAAEHFNGSARPEAASTNGSGAGAGQITSTLAAELVRQLRNRLEPAFTASADEVELTETTNAAFRMWKGERVESFAMDYAVAAFTAGVVSGVTPGTVLRWIVDDDGGPCPDCDDNGLADTTAGQAFPTGQSHPPAHPGCRCLLAPATA